jgi:hypothetical protein
MTNNPHNGGIHLDFSDCYIGRVCPILGAEGHGSVAAGYRFL